MGLRRKGREAAFQLMYQVDVSGTELSVAEGEFWSQMGVPKDARDFASSLVEGVVEKLEEIDDLISSHSHNWKIHRMNSVDRNVLRLGVFELVHCRETPTKVIINEAIEIGKKFGTSDSSAFINGILDKISKNIREDENEDKNE